MAIDKDDERVASRRGSYSYPMNFQLNLSRAIAIIGVDIDFVKSPRDAIRIKGSPILVRQDTRIVGIRGEDPLHRAGPRALELACRWVDGARVRARREGEQGRVAGVDDVRLRAEGRARAGRVPRPQADEAALCLACRRNGGSRSGTLFVFEDVDLEEAFPRERRGRRCRRRVGRRSVSHCPRRSRIGLIPASLGEVFDAAARTVRDDPVRRGGDEGLPHRAGVEKRPTTGVNGLLFSVRETQRAHHGEVVPDLVELAGAVAAERDALAVRRRLHGVFEFRQRVPPRRGREDVARRQDGVRVQRAEQRRRVHEVVEQVGVRHLHTRGL